jgi:putative glutamine amidotransferase
MCTVRWWWSTVAPAGTETAGERPVIGLSAWLEKVRWDRFEEWVAFTEASFVEKLSAVGADSIIIPVQPHLPQDIIRQLDGIVIVGGPDIQTPGYVSDPVAKPRPEVGRRDEVELALARTALEQKIPILGVCRGCQVLNVMAGGTLVPEVAEAFEGIAHSRYDATRIGVPFEFAEHHVETDAATPLGELLGPKFDVLSSHHQAVDEVAPGFVTAAKSSDGLIEAICALDHPFAVGVQWHPEAGATLELFAALVAAAREHRNAR